jgi:hypothetical protein
MADSVTNREQGGQLTCKLKHCGKVNIVGGFSSINTPFSGINASRRDIRYLLKEIKCLECLQTNRIMCEVKLCLNLTN